LHAQSLGQAVQAILGQPHGTRARVELEPPQVEQARHEGSADGTRYVVALLGPVEAAARDVPLLRANVELAQLCRPSLGHSEDDWLWLRIRWALLTYGRGSGARSQAYKDPVAAQSVCDGYAKPPGKVVVATTRVAHRVSPGPLTKRRDALSGRDPGRRLDQLGYARVGEAKVPVAPPDGDGDQSNVEKPAQVVAGGGRRDARLRRQDARGERAPIHEGEKDLGPRRLGQSRADGREIDIANRLRGLGHAANVMPSTV
jgi:hypothetical protein